MDSSIQILESYKDRQVVLNTYYNEELIDKTGLYLDNIETSKNSVKFIKNTQIIYSIDLKKHPNFKPLEGFNDYFELFNDKERIEIYFPHK